jgi:hypothetical protein
MTRANQHLLNLHREGALAPGECDQCGQDDWNPGYDRGDDPTYIGFQCRGCGHITSVEHPEPETPADAPDTTPSTAYVIAELKAIRADLKSCARDTEGLMYERGPDGLQQREFLAAADTNGPPDRCDERIWAARGRVTALLDLLDPTHPKAP